MLDLSRLGSGISDVQWKQLNVEFVQKVKNTDPEVWHNVTVKVGVPVELINLTAVVEQRQFFNVPENGVTILCSDGRCGILSKIKSDTHALLTFPTAEIVFVKYSDLYYDGTNWCKWL